MRRPPKSYLKCEKRDGMYHLTLMRSTGTQLVLAGRDAVPIGDTLALQTCVKDLVTSARAADQRVGMQADGNS